MTYERVLGARRVNRINALRCAVVLSLATSIVACGEDEPEETTEGELGSECDLEKPRCETGLECTPHGESAACTLPAGAECDAEEHENGGCADTALCEAPAAEGDAGADGSEPSTCRIREGEACDPKEELCSGKLECAELKSGDHQCHPKVALRGVVTDTANDDGVEGAHVIGIDAEGSAATNVSISDEDGAYVLYVPVVRNEDGSPSDERFTLQAGAQDYQAFPYGVRVALPIEATDAKLADGEWVVDNALTHIGLIGLPEGERYAISGTLEAAKDSKDDADLSGVLIVAHAGSESHSAITDKSGDFTIFNVTDAEYDLNGYAAQLQVGAQSVSVSGKNVEGVTLTQLLDATTDVSGNIQIVNAAGGSLTSVILVVADTFDADAARGEVPRGLRAPRTGAPDISGDFTISDVPDGEYVVLAAYENDDLVRDPDTNISGTDFVRLTVDHTSGATATLSESFKVTQALEVFAPGAEEAEAVSAKPTLRWADDSSEDWYDLRVFDALGNEVWNALEVPGVSGSDDVSVAYEGPLDPGMYYQFRVTSFRQPGKGDASPISTTEDLRGVFFQPAK